MKLGKLPARPGAVSFNLSQYLEGNAVPTAPISLLPTKYYPKVWGTLGNADYGDCVLAGAAHETMFWNDEAKRFISFTDKSVLSDYSAITGFNPNDPNTDQGTDMQVAASYRRKTGVLDASGNRHKVLAYLALDKGNAQQLKQAVYLFGAVGIGIEFPDSAMDQFNAGKAWTVKAGSQIEGGHYVPVIGYSSTYVYVVTWGKVQKMSWAFYRKYNDESVVYLSEEMLTNNTAPNGLNLTQLLADLKTL